MYYCLCSVCFASTYRPLPTEPAAIASTSDAQAVPTVLDSGVAPLNVPSFPGGIPFVTPSHDSATDPDAVTLAHRLNTTLLRLCSTCVSADGRAVDYSGLAGSPLFATYVHTAAALQVKPPARSRLLSSSCECRDDVCAEDLLQLPVSERA